MEISELSDGHESVVIGLGANLGDPQQQLKRAIEAIDELAVGELKASSLWRSEGVDMQDESSDFVNAVVVMNTRLKPEALLQALQSIEVNMGRPSEHDRNVARTIDLDILLFSDWQVEERYLQIPHPRMLERLFVLLPLQEVLPDYHQAGVPIAELIRNAPKMQISRL